MKKLILLGVFFTGILLGCNQGVQEENAQSDEANPEVAGQPVCLELTYPISYELPDGSTVTGNNREEVSNALRKWHEANPDIKEQAIMQYPVNAVFKGRSITIANEKEMIQYRKECEEPEKPCFALIYPVSYIMPDGTIITVKGIDDLENKALIRDWYTNHPNSKERPGMKYPLDVLLEDGSTMTLMNVEELNALREECE